MEHPSVEAIEALLPPPGEARDLLLHLLSCGECRRRALDSLQAPRPSLYDRYLACFDEIGRHLDGVEDLIDELLDSEGDA